MTLKGEEANWRKHRGVRVDASVSFTLCLHPIVPERDYKGTGLGILPLLVDVEGEPTDRLGPLRGILGDISAAYIDHEVRTQSLAQDHV